MKGLTSLELPEIRRLIESGKLTVSVIGVGRIGLPTAVLFAHAGFQTYGVDINPDLVRAINSGPWPLKDEPGFQELFDDVTKKKRLLRATTDITEAVPRSNLVILSLPTPMSEDNIPDYSALDAVGRSLNKILEPYSVLIVESTVEPGYIENKLMRIIEGDGKRIKFGRNAGIAACPETANPGVILQDFKEVPRLVGAADGKTAKIVSALYRHVFPVEVLELRDCKTANASKLTANVFRDINIAFVNELAMLFEMLDIDILEVLAACDKKYNFQTHYPGAGVGGPCLPVNSYQLLHSLSEGKPFLNIIKAARETNEHMPYHVVDLLVDGLNEAGKSLQGSVVAVLGLSYKPDVKDIQLTPVEHIVERIKQLGGQVRIYDPYFKSTTVFSDNRTESQLDGAVNGADAVVFSTAHKEFRDIEPGWLTSKMRNGHGKSSRPVVVDARGIFDRRAVKKAGLIFRGIGRGGVN